MFQIIYNIGDFYFKKRTSLFVTPTIKNEQKKRETDITKYDLCKNKLFEPNTSPNTSPKPKPKPNPSINLNQIVYNSDTILICGFISISAIITSTYFYFYRKR
jgi:hypothetical protein